MKLENVTFVHYSLTPTSLSIKFWNFHRIMFKRKKEKHDVSSSIRETKLCFHSKPSWEAQKDIPSCPVHICLGFSLCSLLPGMVGEGGGRLPLVGTINPVVLFPILVSVPGGWLYRSAF